ncbi:DEAD/DEAH box helicase family protein [Vibrio parahaemolyticus]|uniref:DEAD/DEAH box helicase n=1 Tax=Vibrio parahaemolyticus TaxID=670 RepID=UPI0004BA21B6|nr:DEAD/DEAH box helicase family protein [Vibrio parahaemolyticus]EKH9212787.1 DEAD/DEAH box helicase family protein [Vibrio parahaemolyticus]MBY4653452.1 DEAD/DEAH box helicase family protein [Vibrio parahaemolyticus]MCR9766287.1 DEAD/DEAH box helicase family protein [Vibrio parahaemolyticus]MCR9891735.1 DEAD/DEAH box helicase family protein [Vibrio parahaemolyticus]MCR9919906.1 DEAD/DEAH box helicase family protein [Vibrio parahaemolyticus]
MMLLRQWQSECAELALNRYQQGQRHFLCLATPGAGKSVMAAEVASRLFKKDNIDFVICFSPSIAISQGLARTFQSHLNCRFDGVIGALGASYTDQSLPFFDESFWALLRNHRALVVFDEIHHCAGLNILEANSWGKAIIEHIQAHARYTLSLTGTPWRSDKAPISLSSYNNFNTEIECDYVYGLSQAVKDGVSRLPKMALVDNDQISATFNGSETRHYSSISQYLDEPFAHYQSIITDDTCMRYLLKSGLARLEAIQEQKPNAAGLVVASSIEHATRIHVILSNEFKKKAAIVTYKHDDPSGIIDDFRSNDIDWIVSVGMISEGTDIPRLQVCCHLSKVKTELYFRQVLGRIQRVNQGQNQEAWLYTFAEPNLVRYAHRIAEEIPEHSVVLREHMSSTVSTLPDKHEPQPSNNLRPVESLEMGAWEASRTTQKVTSLTSQHAEAHNHYFDIVGDFRQQVVDVFRVQNQ